MVKKMDGKSRHMEEIRNKWFASACRWTSAWTAEKFWQIVAFWITKSPLISWSFTKFFRCMHASPTNEIIVFGKHFKVKFKNWMSRPKMHWSFLSCGYCSARIFSKSKFPTISLTKKKFTYSVNLIESCSKSWQIKQFWPKTFLLS